MEERLDHRELARGRWMRFCRIRYRRDDGSEGTWESAERVNDRGAVVVVAGLRPSGRVILIQQYRAPVDAWTIEFPAGLIDPGENPETTVRRELLEETGYHADTVQLLPPSLSSPGLSTEAASIAVVDIDETRPENRTPIPRPAPGENIRVFAVAPEDIARFLEERRADGVLIDMRVLAALVVPALRANHSASTATCPP